MNGDRDESFFKSLQMSRSEGALLKGANVLQRIGQGFPVHLTPLGDSQCLVFLQYWEALLSHMPRAHVQLSSTEDEEEEEEGEDEEDEDDTNLADALTGPVRQALVSSAQIALRLVLPRLRTSSRLLQNLLQKFVLQIIQLQPQFVLTLLIEHTVRDNLTNYLGPPPLGVELIAASLSEDFIVSYDADLSEHTEPLLPSALNATDLIDPESAEANPVPIKPNPMHCLVQVIFMNIFVQRVESMVQQQDYVAAGAALQILCDVLKRSSSFPQNRVPHGVVMHMDENNLETGDGDLAVKSLKLLWCSLVRWLKAVPLPERGILFGLQSLLHLLPLVTVLLPRCLSDLHIILRKVLQMCSAETVKIADVCRDSKSEAAKFRPWVFSYLESQRGSLHHTDNDVNTGWKLSTGCYMLGPYSDPHFSGSLLGFSNDGIGLRKQSVCPSDERELSVSRRDSTISRRSEAAMSRHPASLRQSFQSQVTGSDNRSPSLLSGITTCGHTQVSSDSSILPAAGKNAGSMHHCLPSDKALYSRIRKVMTWSGLTGIVGIQLSVMEYGSGAALIEYEVQGAMEGEKQILELEEEEYLVAGRAYFSGGSLFCLALTTNKRDKSIPLGLGSHSLMIGEGVLLCGQPGESLTGLKAVRDELVDFCGNLGPQGGFATFGAVFRRATSDPWVINSTLVNQPSEVLLRVTKELFDVIYSLFPWFTLRYLRAEIASDPKLWSISSAFLASLRSHPFLLADSETELRGLRWCNFSTDEVTQYVRGLSCALSEGDDGLDLSYQSLYQWMKLGMVTAEEPPSQKIPPAKKEDRPRSETPASLEELQSNCSHKQQTSDVTDNRCRRTSGEADLRFPRSSSFSTSSSEPMFSLEPELLELLDLMTQKVMLLSASLAWEKRHHISELNKEQKRLKRTEEVYRAKLMLCADEKDKYNGHIQALLEQRKLEAKIINEKDAWSHKLNQRLMKSVNFCKSLTEENEVLKQANIELLREVESLKLQITPLNLQVLELSSKLFTEKRWEEQAKKNSKMNWKMVQDIAWLKQKSAPAVSVDQLQRRDQVIAYLLAQVQHLQEMIDGTDQAGEDKGRQSESKSYLNSVPENESPKTPPKRLCVNCGALAKVEEDLRAHIRELEDVCGQQTHTIKSLEMMLKRSQDDALARLESAEKKFATAKAVHTALEQRIFQMMNERAELQTMIQNSRIHKDSMSSEDLNALAFKESSYRNCFGSAQTVRSYEKLVRLPSLRGFRSNTQAACGQAKDTLATLSGAKSNKQLDAKTMPTSSPSLYLTKRGTNLQHSASKEKEGSKNSFSPRPSISSSSDHDKETNQRRFTNSNAGCRPS